MLHPFWEDPSEERRLHPGTLLVGAVGLSFGPSFFAPEQQAGDQIKITKEQCGYRAACVGAHRSGLVRAGTLQVLEQGNSVPLQCGDVVVLHPELLVEAMRVRASTYSNKWSDRCSGRDGIIDSCVLAGDTDPRHCTVRSRLYEPPLLQGDRCCRQGKVGIGCCVSVCFGVCPAAQGTPSACTACGTQCR